MPAAATTISTWPNAETQASRSCWSDPRLPTSDGCRSVRRPRASIAFAASSPAPSRRPVATTSAPASANPSASARPIPVVPPTTTATRPDRSKGGLIGKPDGVQGSGFGDRGSRSLVPVSWFLVPGSGFCALGSRFGFPGSQFWVPGSGFSVPDSAPGDSKNRKQKENKKNENQTTVTQPRRNQSQRTPNPALRTPPPSPDAIAIARGDRSSSAARG